MASERYWERQKAKLLDPEFGANVILAKDPRDLLKGCAMEIALENAIKFHVLGMESKASRIIDYLAPKLRVLLDDKTVCDELRSPTDLRPSSLIGHLETLAIAHWLSTGKYEKPVLARIIREIEIDPDYKVKSLYAPTWNQALICASEYGDDQTTERFYRRWEKSPLEELPATLQFSGNLRHLLVAHVRHGGDHAAHETLRKALGRFADRARNWDKINAVPYVGIMDLARIIFSCERSRGNNLKLSELWPLLL